MPKLIDHSERQQALAEATWRVILRDGITSVSIRTVAAEADVSTGSLRHIFPRRSDLLVFAMQLADQRARARILRHMGAQTDPRTLAINVLRELLPLDEERRAEMQVNFALMAAIATEPGLREENDASFAAIDVLCTRILTLLHSSGLTRPDLDIAMETLAMHALVDGLALHGIMVNDPEFTARIDVALERYIDDLR